jgi:predicted  nucleic acid-binding Zn-ribbon protein
MAEVKLFEVNLNETINNIKRLEEELKAIKKVYKEAAIGSEEFVKAQEAGKELTAEIKKQNDALKANTNALGGINTAAKFAEGSYGKLKQQIKENRDALDKVNIGGKVYKTLMQEQTKLTQKRIDIEKQLPSLFKERVKGAIEEANTIKGLRDQIREYSAAVIKGEAGAAQKLAELKDKLDDVKDATNAFKGTGVERLTASMNLLRESVVNVDLDKFKIGLEGLGASMKALPIFLLVDILGRLIEKFGIIDGIVTLVTDAFFALTDALGLTNKQAEKTSKILIEGLEKQNELISERYDAEIKLAAASGKNTDILELNKLKAVEKNIKTQVDVLNDLKNKKGKLNKEEQESWDKLQIELIKSSSDRATKEAEISKKISDARKDYTKLVQESEDNLKKLRQSSRQNSIDEINKTKAEQLKALDEQFSAGQLYNGNTKQNIAEFEKAKQNIIQASNIEVGKINAEAAKEQKAKRDKIHEDELKRQKELIEGVKRNQDEEISFLESKIQERKNLNESSFAEEEDLIKYQYEVAKYNAEGNFEAMYKAQVDFDSAMLDLQKRQLEEQEKLNKEFAQKDINERRLQQEIILNEQQAINEVNFEDAMTNLETQFEAKQSLISLQREQELLGVDEHSLKYQEIISRYALQEIALEKQKQDEKSKLRQAEVQSVANTMQVIMNLGSLLAKDQQQQAAFAKMAALINVGANTGIAISNLVATSFSPASPDNVMTGGIAAYAKLAAGLVAITSNMVQAKQLINSFEEGGYTGEGNPHEVSTNLGSKSYTYHKDEYVVPSRVLNTSKGSALAGQLENMRLGMSNPMPHISGMFDGGFTGRSAGMETTNMLQNQIMMQKFIESMPNPVVRVTDINKTQGSVQRAVNVSSL